MISAKIISSSFQYHTHKKQTYPDWYCGDAALGGMSSVTDPYIHLVTLGVIQAEWALFHNESCCAIYTKRYKKNTHSKLLTKYHTTFASQISLNLPHSSPCFTKAELMLTCSVYKVYLCDSCWTDKTRFEIRQQGESD